jgi:hypothetical protein
MSVTASSLAPQRLEGARIERVMSRLQVSDPVAALSNLLRFLGQPLGRRDESAKILDGAGDVAQ